MPVLIFIFQSWSEQESVGEKRGDGSGDALPPSGKMLLLLDYYIKYRYYKCGVT